MYLYYNKICIFYKQLNLNSFNISINKVLALILKYSKYILKSLVLGNNVLRPKYSIKITLNSVIFLREGS